MHSSAVDGLITLGSQQSSGQAELSPRCPTRGAADRGPEGSGRSRGGGWGGGGGGVGWLGQCPTQPGSTASGHGVACTSGVAGLRETVAEEWLTSLFISLMVSVDVSPTSEDIKAHIIIIIIVDVMQH